MRVDVGVSVGVSASVGVCVRVGVAVVVVMHVGFGVSVGVGVRMASRWSVRVCAPVRQSGLGRDFHQHAQESIDRNL